jgi:transcriptional regulator with XRE-family HTH domain
VTLQELCAARGLTLAQLAARAGVAVSTVAKLDAAEIRAHPATLRRLAAVLGLEPAALRTELSDARRRQHPASDSPSEGDAEGEGGFARWR